MKIEFGRYKGRACESIYREDSGYCEWVSRLDVTNPAIIEFQEFIKTSGKDWEDTYREMTRREREERGKPEENRRIAESNAEERMQDASTSRRHVGGNG